MKLEKEDLSRAFAQSDILKYFRHFLAMKNYTYNLHTGFVLSNNRDTERELETEFRTWVTVIRADIKLTGGVPGLFNATLGPSDAIRLYKSEEYTRHIGLMKSKLTYDPAKREVALDELRRFTHILTGDNKELDVAALYSFIWQVKRKFFELPVVHHIMPILYSNMQGSGKTQTMHRITLTKTDCKGNESNILLPLAASVKKSEGFDERNRHLFASCSIIKLDEVEIEKDQYNVVKSLITDDTVQWRPLRTNDAITRKNRATLIATSNLPLDSLVFDESGVRRFYQINVRKFDIQTQEGLVQASEQEESLTNIRYEDIWSGIDESLSYKDTYHAKFAEQFNVVAEITRNRGDFELYLNEAGISAGGDTFIRTAWINAEFKQWAYNNTSVKWFKKDYKRHFTKIGLNLVKTGGHEGYYVTLSEEAAVAYANWIGYDETRYKIGI